MSALGANRSIGGLEQAQGFAENPSADDPESTSMTALIDRIVNVHHAHLRKELPRLLKLADRVAEVHGPHDPALGELREVLAVLKDDLESHMIKEEWCVFPKIMRWEAARSTGLCPDEGDGSFRSLEIDHRDASATLARLRKLTNGFTAKADACAMYRVLLEGLAELEAELLQHVYEENDLLFPRACVAAALLRARAAIGGPLFQYRETW
ncbi:MAG: hemerythrin domain-containing protein [Isosphaeraceae bacterium]|nr:hemerythrin domain-containing protein [Isosphaeraceae bacterium]